MARVIASSGNVFADLGLADAEDLSLKAGLALTIGDVIRKRGLKQVEAAEITGISQPELSRLLRGKIRDFSSDRLVAAIRSLQTEVDIRFTHQGQTIGDLHLEPFPA